MRLHRIDTALSVCKINGTEGVDLARDYTFLSKTDEEISLVCPTDRVPENTLAREDGWLGFRLVGQFEFTLTGVLAPILHILAQEKIGIFAISTYNTDYVLVKAENLERALSVLREKGYETD